MTFYRKYRPRTIADLDLETVVKEGLGKLLEGQSLGHAYLFTGPRGSGKTSAARILAKLVNCRENKTALVEGGKLVEPCLECENCKSIESGSNLDVIEIDAASNRGIDAIRELRDKIGLSPASGLKKVYIIDEVHMLTTEAFNALLKTLEEPPAHAMFVLCTTEAHKVPSTIASRCRAVTFTKATPQEVKKSLQKAIGGEKLEIEPEALKKLAAAVDGSFREGHKLLEQLASGGEKITTVQVEKILGLAFVHSPMALAQAIAQSQAKEALLLISQLDKQGIDWSAFLVEMLRFYQKELEANYGLGEKQTELSINQLRNAAKLVGVAASEVRSSPLASLPLELAVIGQVEAVNGGDPAYPHGIKKNFSDPQLNPTVSLRTVKVAEEIENFQPKVRQEKEWPTDLKLELTTILDKWPEVISACEPKNHSVAGLLRSTKPKSLDGRDLILEVFYKFHKEQLESETKMIVLEETLAAIIGPLRVHLVLGERTVRTLAVSPEDDNVSAAPVEDNQLEAVEKVFGLIH